MVMIMTRCNLIAAVDTKWGIGKNGGIPWMIPEDLKLFKDKTIVMGYKTFSSFPGGIPLKNRKHVVFTRDHNHKTNNNNKDCVHFVSSKEEAWELLKNEDEFYVIGGKNIYDMYFQDADYLHLTLVSGDYACDVSFPHEHMGQHFRLIDYSDECLSNGNRYRFVTYKNTKKVNSFGVEKCYLDLLKDVLDNGSMRKDRTGTGTMSVFGRQLRFDISESIPALTTNN